MFIPRLKHSPDAVDDFVLVSELFDLLTQSNPLLPLLFDDVGGCLLQKVLVQELLLSDSEFFLEPGQFLFKAPSFTVEVQDILEDHKDFHGLHHGARGLRRLGLTFRLQNGKIAEPGEVADGACVAVEQ